jgi:hypothetical protein
MCKTMNRYTYTRLAWELARRASLEPAGDGVRATVILADGALIAADGRTSSDAMGALAEDLDRCLGDSRP